MILDERLEFADNAAIPTAAARALLGDVIDLGSVGRDIGVGDAMFFVVQVTEAVTSGGAATVTFDLVTDAQAAIAVDGTATIHYSSGAIDKTALTLGAQPVMVGTPRAGRTYERYLGVLTTPSAILTAGKVNAFLTHDVARFQAYPNAY